MRIDRTRPLLICATTIAPDPVADDSVICAVVLYPAPGVTMFIAVITPEPLTVAVIVAGVSQVPVTVTVGGLL